MKAIQFTCDGCEKTTSTYVSCDYPVGWSTRTATVDPATNTVTEFDLCGGCFRHFNDAANPKSWPRMAKAS